jgi:hypothetical protein
MMFIYVHEKRLWELEVICPRSYQHQGKKR